MTIKVGLTRDLLTPDGEPSFGTAPLELLDACDKIDWEFLDESLERITPEIAARYDALYVNSPQVPGSAVGAPDCRLKIVARHGVGYDSVDVAALAAKGVIVTNTPKAIQRPVAVATLTMLFALAGRLFQKDKLTRAGQWDERTGHMGLGLTTRTLGIIGAGGIGQELLRLAAPFGWKMLAADPFATPSHIEALGAEHCELGDLLERSDFVVTCCILNEDTHHLMGQAQFAQMRNSAFFVNVARGPVVDEHALIEALNTHQIAGAGLDVFEQEPVDPNNPLLSMDNVIVTPHALCWTDECFDAIAREGLGCVVDFAEGRKPGSIVTG